MRSGHHPLLLTILFRNALCVRPNLNDERLVSTLGGDGNHVSNVNVTCPTAIPSETSRFDFELTPEKVYDWLRWYYNPNSHYSLHRTAECNGLIDVSVTVFLMMDSENPFESKVSIVLGDEVMLQPHLQMQPMYVCNSPTLYENMDAQAQGAKVVAAVNRNRQCFCRLNLRTLRHQKPLRRHFMDIPWETWNWLVPERCIMAAIWFLESKLSPQSSGSVTKKAKLVSIRDARLKMLLQLEDVDSTYGPFCPNVLAAFDICYLAMLVIVLILPIGLAIVVSRKLPDTWRLEDADVTKTFKIDDPVQLCRAWGLQIGAFVGFILALQGVAIRFIIDPKLLPFIIGFSMLVGLLGLFQMMNTFCRAQLANAALAHGLQVCWGSSKGRFSVLIANASFAPAVAASCCFILIGAASNNLGLTVTAGIVMIPAALGIAKAVVFLREKEMGLQRSLVPAFVSEVFASAENVSSQKAQVPSDKRGSLRRLSGKAFLNCCRFDENPHTKGTEDLNSADEDSDDDDAFQLLCDLPWHGRAVWRLAGTRIAWLNPLLLALLTFLILGTSSARFAVIVCTPPALLDFQPATGQLAPQFRKGRRHYAWFRDLTLKEEMEVFSYTKISRVELNDSLNSGVNVGFWDRSKEGCITNCTVQSDQLGLVQKTYTVADVPVHVAPATVRLRVGNFDRCVWFSMLKSTDHGFVPISVPGDVGSGINVSVSVSFRQFTNEMPVQFQQAGEDFTLDTVCRNKSQATAFGNMSCDETCEQEPRCLVAKELKNHCCFTWLPKLQSEEVCKLENAEVPLVQRLVAGRSVEGITLQGSAGINNAAAESHRLDKKSANKSTIEWTFPLKSSNFGDYFLHLNQLGAEATQKFGAMLTLSVGTPKMQGAMAVLEANEQEDVAVSIESDHEQNQIIHLSPNENFSFLKSGFSRKLHVVPLLADHSLSYKLICKTELKSDECQPLAEEEKLKLLFRKKCLSNQALGRWYDVCDGLFPARLLSVEVNLLNSSTEAFVEIKPSEERFNSSMGKIIVQPHFMSEELRVKMLQKDSKNDSCRVPGTMEETMEQLAPTPFACAVFEAKCRNLSFLDGETVTSTIPVLSKNKKRAGVLSSFKARLNNTQFATVALCAVEHPKLFKLKPKLITKMLGEVSINDLLTANQAGAKVGAHAWELIRSSLRASGRSSALDSFVAAITGNTTDDMVWAVLRGILYHSRGSLDLCSKSNIVEELTNAAMMMMDLGDIKSAQRFLRVVQQHNPKKYACFCNIILLQYVEDFREMRGKSLKKLSDLLVFQPTQAVIAAGNFLSQNDVKGLPDVPIFPTVRFISMADALPTHAMKFLATLPPNVKVVSLPRLNFWRTSGQDDFLAAWSGGVKGEVRPSLKRLVLSAPQNVESDAEWEGFFHLIVALWNAKIGELGLSNMVFHPDAPLYSGQLGKFRASLKPHQTIKALAFSCKLCGEMDPLSGYYGAPNCGAAACDCRPDLLVDLVVNLPLLQNLSYSLNSGLDPPNPPKPPKHLDDEYYGAPEAACLEHDRLVYLARALSDHKNLTHLELRGRAYEILPGISNQSIDKFKEIRVEIPSKLLQDEEVKSVMKREKQRFGPTLRIETRRIKAT